MFLVLDIIEYIIQRIIYKDYTSELFNQFVRQYILPKINSSNKFYLVLILDNTEIYYNVKLKNIYITIGIILIFLSLYSLDFNSIRMFFILFKIQIKRNYKFINIYNKERKEFLDFLNNATEFNYKVASRRLYFIVQETFKKISKKFYKKFI